MECPSFNALLQQSITEHWDLDALSDYGAQTFRYKDVARIIEKLEHQQIVDIPPARLQAYLFELANALGIANVSNK